MRSLTPREHRTIRLAGILIAVYLVAFGSFKAWQWLHQRRTAYLQTVTAAQTLKLALQPYEDKVASVNKLMTDYHLDPALISRQTEMAEASAAIQKAAKEGNLMIGTIRESAAPASSKALGTIQLDGAGPVNAIMALLHNLPRLGHPLVIDSVQLTTEPSRPGQLKVSLTILVLDFELWKKTEATHA
jgi:hypothetical protein